MKKPINLFVVGISVLLVIGLIVGAVFFFFMWNGDDETDTEQPTGLDTTNLELLKATSLSDVKSYIETNTLDALLSDDGKMYILNDVTISSEQFDVSFQFDDTELLKRVDADCTVTLDKSNEGSVKDMLSVIAGTVVEFFKLQDEPDYLIYDSEGAQIDSKVKNPVKELMNGKAKYVLSAIDFDDTYWYLSIKKAEDGKDNQFTLECFHYFVQGAYRDGTEVINLTESEE